MKERVYRLTAEIRIPTIEAPPPPPLLKLISNVRARGKRDAIREAKLRLAENITERSFLAGCLPHVTATLIDQQNGTTVWSWPERPFESEKRRLHPPLWLKSPEKLLARQAV